MQKVVKINSKQSIKLDANFSWLYAYRNQFGVDIAPKLIPALNAGVALYAEVAKHTGEGQTAADIFREIPALEIQNAITELAGLELVDLVNIIWALAKAADDTIDPPEVWVRQFDTFPLDVILPAAVGLVLDSSISTKNLKTLHGLTTPAEG